MSYSGELILHVGEVEHVFESYTCIKILGKLRSSGGLPSANLLKLHMIVDKIESTKGLSDF